VEEGTGKKERKHFLLPSSSFPEAGRARDAVWTKLLETKNAYTAEIWKELLNAEAVLVRVVPASGWANAAELEPHILYVPWGKAHVAQEILRKI